eukprot:g10938.t1
MSAASVQLVRLISLKTAPKRTSDGASSISESASGGRPSLLGGLGGRRRASSAAQDRFSTSPSSSRGGEHGAGKNVGIEVFAHGASGEEAVLVAFLSNSVLLVLRVAAEGLRSWLLEWPVAGKIRGLCVSPDLQCVLCVTEGLEGVYLLAIDNLGEQDETSPHRAEAVRSLEDGATTTNLHVSGGDSGLEGGAAAAAHAGGGGDTSDGEREKSGGAKRSPAATTARHAPKRTVADTAFPSLVHLASRGEQRKRGPGSAKARYPLAEPVFIASLARRGAGRGGGARESGDDRGSRRHSTGSGAPGSRGPRQRGGSSRKATSPFECLWWVTRGGDHFAVIGGPGGEVHFLDLERLGAWVVTPPPPAMARGRVCALSIVADLAGTPPRSWPARTSSDSAPPPGVPGAVAGQEQSHLVAVLETGAVFVVLLERSSGGASNNGGEVGTGGPEDEVESESRDKSGEKNKKRGGGGNSGKGEGGESQDSLGEYVRLGADGAADRPEFAPSWLDVGRGGGGGGGGGMGVRAMPAMKRGRDDYSGRLRMSIVSRAWGNKCAVKILRVAGPPGGPAAGSSEDKEKEQQGWGREWGNIAGGGGGGGSGRQQALRTETVRQVTLPVDHPVPEQHALSAVDGSYAVLASPPAGGAPSRVTVAPLGGPELPAAHPVCVFPLPAGEIVRGVALLPCGREGGSRANGDGEAAGSASAPGSSWGLVWSESCVYRVDLGVDVREPAAAPKAATDTAGPAPVSATPKVRLPSTPSRQPLAKASVSIALRRPPAAAVRRAHELHTVGALSEAARVAMEALDGVPTASATPSSRGAGGEATTRMVREELANSLLEWLVTLHVRQATANLRPAAGCGGSSEGEEGGAAVSAGSVDSGSSHVSKTPDSDKVKGRRSSTGSPAAGGFHGRPARRGSKPTPPSRLAPKGGPKKRESVLATPTKTPNKAGSPSAVEATEASSCRLERYLLSSRDYDPMLAATLLHEHGEADLAIVAGTARGEEGGGGTVLPKVLRVLAESTWPPRLGPRAVDALCGDETGQAAREVVHASGGTLFAALEPGLQLRMLLSHKSVVFSGAEAWGALAGEEDRGAAEVGEAAAAVETGAGGGIAGVRRLLGPVVPALSTEELSVLVCRLAEWCKEDGAGQRPVGGSGDGVAAAAAADQASPSAAALETLEVLLQALCELARRPPPHAGEHHGRAWSRAGCIMDGPGGYDTREPGAPPLEWAQLTASLCGILTGKGEAPGSGGSGGGGGDTGGGLPTAARRQVLQVLPIVWGWHDPVGVLWRLREAGCWAAVALQLELSGNWQEAASATLHGVVAYLLGGERGAQGENARILSGNALRTGFGAPRPSRPRCTSATEADMNRTASEAVLRVIDKHAFPVTRDGSTADGSETVEAAPLSPAASLRPPRAASTSAVVLKRASVLSEALHVWKHLGLPVASLEACLRPQLADGDGTRVLAAVFFPQLSRDAARNGAPGSGQLGQDDQRRSRGLGGVGGRGTQTASKDRAANPHDLGLSPRFLLALMRAAGKPAALGSVSPSLYHAPSDGLRSAVGSAGAVTSSGSSQLALLLEHQAGDGGGSELDSAWVRLGATASSGLPSGSGRRGSRADVGSAWPPPVPGVRGAAQGHAPSCSGRADAAADRDADTAVWVFSCGHRFLRRDLLDKVLPASASSVRQTTASLERTQQALALEYEGRHSFAAGAACPECAAKELVRLAAVAGSSMQARGAPTASSNSSPPPPPHRWPTQERARVLTVDMDSQRDLPRSMLKKKLKEEAAASAIPPIGIQQHLGRPFTDEEVQTYADRTLQPDNDYYGAKGLARTLEGALRPMMADGIPLVKRVVPERITDNLFLLPGSPVIEDIDRRMTISEGQLADPAHRHWQGPPLHVIMETARVVEADIVLLDLNPSLSTINRNMLMSSDYIVITTRPEEYSLENMDTFVNKMARDDLFADTYGGSWLQQMIHHIRPEVNYERVPGKPPRFPLPTTVPKILGCVIADYSSQGNVENTMNPTRPPDFISTQVNGVFHDGAAGAIQTGMNSVQQMLNRAADFRRRYDQLAWNILKLMNGDPGGKLEGLLDWALQDRRDLAGGPTRPDDGCPLAPPGVNPGF